MSKKSAGQDPGAPPSAMTPDALQTLARAGEAAWGDLSRARRRVLKLLRRLGLTPPGGQVCCTPAHLEWLARQRLGHSALEIVIADHVDEVRHAAERVARLDHAMDEVWARSAGSRRSAGAVRPARAARSASAATRRSRTAPRS